MWSPCTSVKFKANRPSINNQEVEVVVVRGHRAMSVSKSSVKLQNLPQAFSGSVLWMCVFFFFGFRPKNQLGPSEREGFGSVFSRVLLDLQTTSFEIP